MKYKALFSLFLLTSSLKAENEETYTPLYAGTQLAIFPTNSAPGHLAVQPFLYYIHNNGAYNSNWSEKSLKATESLTNLHTQKTNNTDKQNNRQNHKRTKRQNGSQYTFVIGDTSLLL